jgi:hypothetical protein
MHLAALDHCKGDRKAAHEAGGGDPAARFVLAHPQPANAKFEERAARRLQVEATLFDLAEVPEEPCEQPAPLTDKGVNAHEQFVIGQIREIHPR